MKKRVYRRNSMVCLSVCLSVAIVTVLQNGSTNRDVVWVVDSGGSEEPYVRRRGSRSPMRKSILKGKWQPCGHPCAVKHMDLMPWAVRKRLNRSRCRLGYGLGSMCAWKHVLDGVAIWRHLANTTEPSMCGDDAGFFVNLLWPLVHNGARPPSWIFKCSSF